MISQDVMEKIIKIPTEEEYMEQLTEELAKEGFVITNFSKGGVLHTILWIVVHGIIQLKELAVDIINSAFMAHCPDDLVEVRAADYSKSRKEGVKASGYLTVHRREYAYSVKVRKGHPFTTNPDAAGNYLTFYASEDTILPEGEETCQVPIEAAEAGSAFNVAAGAICRTLVQIDGYDRVINEPGWLKISGTEEETLESLRRRCLNSRAENAFFNIDQKLKSVVESIPGVDYAIINSQSPRGEGTTDIIIRGSDGIAGEDIIKNVQDTVDELKGSYGDYLVKTFTPYVVDFDLKVFIEKNVSVEGYAQKVKDAIHGLMTINKRSDLNNFYRDEIIGALISTIDNYKKCIILSPADDIRVASDQLLTAGSINVTVVNVE